MSSKNKSLSTAKIGTVWSLALALVLSLFVALPSTATFRASDGTQDQTFATNSGTGFNGNVTATALQSDGKILLSGIFTNYKGVTENATRITRLNANGTHDASFATGSGLNINASLAFDAGTNAVYLGADGPTSPMTYKGSNVSRLIKLDSNGVLDTTFSANVANHISNSDNGRITSVVVEPSGSILVAGGFTVSSGSVTRTGLARFNADGTLDSAFHENLGGGPNNTVFQISRSPNGDIVAVGTFEKFNLANSSDTTVRNIAKISSTGVFQSSFAANSGTGFNGHAYQVVSQPDNKLIVAGRFTTYNGSTYERIIRLNSDGTPDSTFSTAGSGNGFSANGNEGRNVALADDGSIYVQSHLADSSRPTYRGVEAPSGAGIFRISSTGQLDSGFNLAAGMSFNVRQLVPLPNGDILVAGAFTGFGSPAVNRIALFTRASSSSSSGGGGSSGSGGASSPLVIDVLPKKVTVSNEIVTLFGAGLDAFTGATVNGKPVRVVQAGPNRFTFRAPSGLSGVYDITLTGNTTSLLVPKSLTYATTIMDGARTIVPGFAANSIVLTKAMRQEVRAFLRANPGLNEVVCKGFTSAPATAQDRALARDRGKVTCDLIKKLRPEATVALRSGSHTDQPGLKVRRVQITLR